MLNLAFALKSGHDGYYMMLFQELTHQPEFPQIDLTENNAEVLEIFLANQQVVHIGHETAEVRDLAFRLGHPATVDGSRRNLDLEGGKLRPLNTE